MLWYVTVAIMTLALFGGFVHVVRSTTSVTPDIHISDGGRPISNYVINDMLSRNYGFFDMVAGTEYEDGYYKFFSLKNLRICCTFTIAIGLALLFSHDLVWHYFTTTVDAAPGWLWNLIVYRIQNAEWF